MVPLVYIGECPWTTFDEVMAFADKQMYGVDLPAEGIVIHSVNEEFSAVLSGRLSFKAISRQYRLKYGI